MIDVTNSLQYGTCLTRARRICSKFQRQTDNKHYGLIRLLAADAQPKNLSLSQDLSSNPTNMQKIQALGVVVLVSYVSRRTPTVDTVTDFLIKLDIKPCMHLLEISIFSLNDVIVELTKIMIRADKNWAHF